MAFSAFQFKLIIYKSIQIIQMMVDTETKKKANLKTEFVFFQDTWWFLQWKHEAWGACETSGEPAERRRPICGQAVLRGRVRQPLQTDQPQERGLGPQEGVGAVDLKVTEQQASQQLRATLDFYIISQHTINGTLFKWGLMNDALKVMIDIFFCLCFSLAVNTWLKLKVTELDSQWVWMNWLLHTLTWALISCNT